MATGLAGAAAFLFRQRLEAAPKMQLVETEDDIEGRFYKPDAPERSVLFEEGASGKRLDLSGLVLNTEGKPVTLALLDVWQTLDVLQPNGEAQYDNEGVGMRGRLYTNDRGFYRLRTLIPTPHVVGNRSRPAHIHFLVGGEGYREIITALYLAGDDHIDSDTVFGVTDSLVTDVRHDDPNCPVPGMASIEFNFELAAATAADLTGRVGADPKQIVKE